ncbi:MAG: isoprenylcysteine carboxylmethyltransferase family protein [bacterium]
MHLKLINLSDPLILINVIFQSIIALCGLAILIAILINFLDDRKNKRQAKENKHFVETESMFLFFLIFFLIISFKIGVIEVFPRQLSWIINLFLLLTIIFSTTINLLGRANLGKNWANQIRIYQDQTLITTGVYSIVRHPLYASLIWIFFALSLITENWLAFTINLLIFIPMMYWRAYHEEKLLKLRFSGYQNYQKQTAMFLIKPEKIIAYFKFLIKKLNGKA